MAGKSIGTFKRKEYGTWNVWKTAYSRKELLERRATLAKAVNSRLRRLEGQKSISGRNVLDYKQFDTIMEALDFKGRRRFSEAVNQPSLSLYALKNEIVLFESFLEMKSSTIGGLRRLEDKRVNSFIEKGVPESIASDPEFYRFLDSETFDDLANTDYTSEDIIDIFESASDNNLTLEQIIEEFEAFRSSKKERRSGWKAMLERVKKRGSMEKKTAKDRNYRSR